ncbi:nitronate monooxygenase, partial [bacterium]|nr:nitronate monooxygenase [bacterium]
MTRRTFLGLVGAGLSGAEMNPSNHQSRPTAQRLVFRTALCDLLGIEYPVIQSGMRRVAGPELAAAVCNAGGFGILAGLGTPADELRNQIRRIREVTSRPFAVNLWLHSQLLPPPNPADIAEDTMKAAQNVLNRFRERLKLDATAKRPAPFPDVIDQAFDVILEEKVPVFSIGLGNPSTDMVRRCKEHKIKIMAMVATVEDARAVEASGVDIIVAQGGEAGGHRSTWVKPATREHANIGTMALVPQIVNAVKVPVVAAGGLADGRGLVAALALGASGILLGTRFVATKESMAPPVWKKTLTEESSDHTTVTDVLSGLPARTLRNTFTEEYAASGAPVLPPMLPFLALPIIFALNWLLPQPASRAIVIFLVALSLFNVWTQTIAGQYF